MKERRKIMLAGHLWVGTQYRAAHQKTPGAGRLAKTQITSPAKQAFNNTKSFEKLLTLIACNFSPSDAVITLTYRDGNRPRTKEEADKRLSAFIRAFRAYRKGHGQELRYIRVTEGYHSGMRMHHHVIINTEAREIRKARAEIAPLWTDGDDIDVRPLKWGPPEDRAPLGKRPKEKPRDNFYLTWAHYLTKEPREMGRRREGERMWRASIGMRRPTIIYSMVPESDRLEAPIGAHIVDNNMRTNAYGHFHTIMALLPDGAEK